MKDFWEEEVHLIVSRIGGNGVIFKIKQEDEGNSKIRVLHGNMIMKIDDILGNFDWNISTSKKEKVRQKNESPKTSNRKTIAKRTDSNEETAESDEEYPLQFAPGDLYMLLRSSKNNEKRVTLIKDLDSQAAHNQAAHNRKLTEEETYKQSDIDLTVDSSTNIKNQEFRTILK